MGQFFTEVYHIVEQIPYGKVVSYGQIAYMLGRPHAAREVGRAMRFCPEYLPWHRVVMADGSIAAGGMSEIRRGILKSEGVPFLQDGRVDISICRWKG
ncbi:MAG: methylated-DNA--[protein]-cysteine S-methyltransferase [Tissierella sp.]|nr:methylated-DNA--[protein]-cysteine S-methyltransferase [Tissierella sp.]